MKKNTASRYPGARPFEIDQQLIFKGRHADTESLFEKIQLADLVVLFGKSGTGKSSLLNAGIIPKIKSETDFLPVRVRFNAWGEHAQFAAPTDNARLSVRGDVTAHRTFLDKLLPDEASLWHDVKEHYIRHGGENGLLLVMDQFEELFTYPEAQIEAFGEELAEALYKNVPQRYWDILQNAHRQGQHPLDAEEMRLFQNKPALKVVLSIRSDRLHLLNRLERYLPTILKHCYELGALGPAAARQAITEPAAMPSMDWFDTAPFLYQDAAVEKIIHFLMTGEEQDAATPAAALAPLVQKIEATQLQIICSEVENRVKAGKLSIVTTEQVPDLEAIIEKYYENKIGELPSTERLPARRLIEEGLVFEEEERRLSLYEGQIFKTYKIRPETLRQLVNAHLLRAEPSLSGGYTYELSHDTLVAPVLKAKNLRLDAERKTAEAEEKIRKAAELETLRHQAEQERLRAEDAERLRNEAVRSKNEAERLHQEAERLKELEAQRAQEAERLRDEAERGRRRARWMSVLAIAVAIVALVMGYWADTAQKKARKSANEAEQAYRYLKTGQAEKARLEIKTLRERGGQLFGSQFFQSAKELFQQADTLGTTFLDSLERQTVHQEFEYKINQCNQQMPQK